MAKPLSIEFPRSMVEVVTSWNLPMSRFLHTCESSSCVPAAVDSLVTVYFCLLLLFHVPEGNANAPYLSVSLVL